MAVKIKLARFGKIREPFYRIVVADARTRRSGRAIENIGLYHPKADPSVIEIESDRALYWLGVGAQPTEPVLALLKVTGDWQKFKGLPGAEGTLRPQPVKSDKRALYEAAMASVSSDDANSATTPKRKRTAPATEATAVAPAESATAADNTATAADNTASVADNTASVADNTATVADNTATAADTPAAADNSATAADTGTKSADPS